MGHCWEGPGCLLAPKGREQVDREVATEEQVGEAEVAGHPCPTQLERLRPFQPLWAPYTAGYGGSAGVGPGSSGWGWQQLSLRRAGPHVPSRVPLMINRSSRGAEEDAGDPSEPATAPSRPPGRRLTGPGGGTPPAAGWAAYVSSGLPHTNARVPGIAAVAGWEDRPVSVERTPHSQPGPHCC